MIRLRFLVILGGGGGVLSLRFITSPYMASLCEINLIIRSFQSPSAPSPTPASPQEEDEYSDISPSYVFLLCTAAPMTFFIFTGRSARFRQGRFFLLLYITHRLWIH